MDNINNLRDINACPKHTCCYYPLTTVTYLLLKQLLLVYSISLIEQAVYLLYYALSLCIALGIDNPL